MQISDYRIDKALNAIHRNISGNLTAANLARIAACSEQHFHRIFKASVGECVHEYVRRTRLEQAANQLMFDRDKPVVEIAALCGFSSLSSFSRVFKNQFGVPPGRWRTREEKSETAPWHSDAEIAAGYSRIRTFQLPRAQLVERAEQPVAYVRHQGYGRSIRKPWQTLQAWCLAENRSFRNQIGLHHSNPAWVNLDLCRYVACVPITEPVVRRGPVSAMLLPGGLHAAFELQGKYGELLPWLSRLQDEWLPDSGFTMRTTPAFVEYRKNHFLEQDDTFELTLFLPIGLY
ncbi:MAG: GyrI-like domain-containing protein [Halioglobus sp.]